MTSCMALWHKVEFGLKLDKECHGCAKQRHVLDPLSESVQQPPHFSDKCPDREPIPTYPNYRPRFRQY